MSLQDIATLIGLFVTGAGLIVTGIGLLFTARQLRLAHKTARGEFLLHLDERFRHHDKVHRLLQNDKNWPSADVPNPEYIGPDSFTYPLNDGPAYSNPATVFIQVVEPTCELFRFTNLNSWINEGGGQAIIAVERTYSAPRHTS